MYAPVGGSSLPFLTELDSRAQVKGSRDPLGFVPVWSRFGRRVIGNLTTVSNSVRGFTTLLLGYYFGEQAQERWGASAGTTLDLFLKFEQLAAYCRHHSKDFEFRGVERVSQKLAQTSSVKIGAAQDTQILSNQKIYGLWGLFSVPARNSGLLKEEELTLTEEAKEHVKRVLLPSLKRRGLKDPDTILELLKQDHPTVHLEGRHEPLATALAGTLRPKVGREEVAFYEHHLLKGGSTNDARRHQQCLAELIRDLPTNTPFDMKELQTMVQAAEKRGWDELSSHLDAIGALEPLLVAATQAFALLCSRDGRELASVAGELDDCWKGGLRFLRLDKLESEVPLLKEGYSEEPAARRLLDIAQALSQGDFSQALKLLLDQNEFIMDSRHGAEPWVNLERGRLKVYFTDEIDTLSKKQELRVRWQNTYFLNSLKRVSTTLVNA